MSIEAKARLIVPALHLLYRTLCRFSYPMIRFFARLILMPRGARTPFGWLGGRELRATGRAASSSRRPRTPCQVTAMEEYPPWAC